MQFVSQANLVLHNLDGRDPGLSSLEDSGQHLLWFCCQYRLIFYPVFDLALSWDINCIGRKTATIIRAPINGIIVVRPISEPLKSVM